MDTDVTCSPDISLWPAAENPFQRFQTEQEELEGQLLRSFDELEARRAELEEDQNRLLRLEDALTEQRATLEADREKLARERAAFQAKRDNTTENAGTRDDADVAETMEKLALAEQELESLHAELSQQSANEEKRKQDRLQQEEQYSVLELELEHVRQRASELTHSLSSSRNEWEQERETGEQERKELRTRLSRQQEQIEHLSRNEELLRESRDSASAPAQEEDKTSKKEDAAVVGSVLAQFERIRNERAIRRRKAKEQS